MLNVTRNIFINQNQNKMRAVNRFILFVFAAFLFFSCKKTNDVAEDDLMYKQKLEGLVKLSPGTTSINSANKKSELSFKSYKEAYNFFSSFMSKVEGVDTLIGGNAKNSILFRYDYHSTQWLHSFSFYAKPMVVRTVGGTFGMGQIVFTYEIGGLVYNSGTIAETHVTSPQMEVSGLGHTTGEVNVHKARETMFTFSCVKAGTADIIGLPMSFFITIAGNISISAGGSYVTTYMQATAH